MIFCSQIECGAENSGAIKSLGGEAVRCGISNTLVHKHFSSG